MICRINHFLSPRLVLMSRVATLLLCSSTVLAQGVRSSSSAVHVPTNPPPGPIGPVRPTNCLARYSYGELAFEPSVISTVVGNGTAGYTGDGGIATAATLNGPQGIAFDLQNSLYIADTNNYVIRQVPAGPDVIGTLNTGNTGSGIIYGAQQIAVDSCQNLFVNDGGQQIDYLILNQNFTINGKIYSLASYLNQNYGIGNPSGVAVDSSDNVYIADTSYYGIDLYEPSTDTAEYFTGQYGPTSPSTGCTAGVDNYIGYASFGGPSGVSVDVNGNIYVLDCNNVFVIFEDQAGSPLANLISILNPGVVPQTNYMYTLAGTSGSQNPSPGNNGDGGPATSAYLQNPMSVAVDPAGDLFIADGNDTVREVNVSSGIIHTIAGTPGVAGYSGDGGVATNAVLDTVPSVALDAGGDIYIAQPNENVIREVGPSSIIQFASQAINTISGPQTVTLENRGNADLDFLADPQVSSGFTLVSTASAPGTSCGSNGYTLSSGTSCTIQVQFDPLFGGLNTGSVVFTTDGSPTSMPTTQEIVVSGNGVTGNTPSVTVLSSTPNPSYYATPVTLTASVSSSGGSTPTGVVAFSVNGTVIGTSPLMSGVASISTSTLNVGTYSLTATYSGDATYQGSTSASLPQATNVDTTATMVSLLPTTSYPGTIVKATITVTDTAVASVTPTGSVSCTATGTSLSFSGPLTNGAATWSISGLQIGAYNITCNYIPDPTFAASASAIVTETMISAPQAGWTLSGTMPQGVDLPSVTMLNSGQVLVAGGNSNFAAGDSGATASSELYSPSSGFTTTGSLYTARWEHTGSLLPNGLVMVAGGVNRSQGVLSDVELFDSTSNSGIGGFIPNPGGSLNYPRFSHTATTISGGAVLIAGGLTGANGQGTWPIGQAEVATPGTGTVTFAKVGSLNIPRFDHTATLLQDGTVLFVGGRDNNNEAISKAEIYNPGTQQFSYTQGGLNTARNGHTATLLPNGMVLIAGGEDNNGNILQSTELYNPANGGSFSSSVDLPAPSIHQGSASLNDGSILLYGGDNNAPPTKASEIYKYNATSGGSFTAGPLLNDARDNPSTIALSDGTLVAIGGMGNATNAPAEIYDDASKITGVLNPKYIIMGITYAPPGPSSYVTYQNTTYVGNTSSITSSYSANETISVSIGTQATGPGAGVSGWVDGSITGTTTSSWTQFSSSTSSITMTGQTSNLWHTSGTLNAYSPVDHDYDYIWLWLNPLVVLTVDANLPQAPPVWNGYGFDEADGIAPDIWPVYVGCLNGDFSSTSSDCTQDFNKLARTWATNQYWPAGGGPALTQADYAAILPSDPFTNPSGYVVTLNSAYPATTLDGRFTQATSVPTGSSSVGNAEQVVYAQAGPGVPPLTQTYQTTYSNSNMYSGTVTNTYSQAFSIAEQFNASFFLVSATYKLMESGMFTWVNTHMNSTTNTSTEAATVYISGPPCNAPYCTPTYSGIPPLQPSDFDVYQDNLYGSFMFYGDR